MPNGKITQYKNNIFTNSGQTDVTGFADKLRKVDEKIRNAITEAKEKGKEFTVYYGFHGDMDGEYLHEFNEEELEESIEISKEFPIVKMVQVKSPDDSQIEYEKHNKNGYALFTWCDSEKYIKDKGCLILDPLE